MGPMAGGEVPRDGSLAIPAESFLGSLAGGMESVAASGAGATANPARFKWLSRHNAIRQKLGVPTARPSAACARFKFGDSRMGDAQFVADVPAGSAGCRGAIATSLVEADIPPSRVVGNWSRSEGNRAFRATVYVWGKWAYSYRWR